MKEEEGNCEVLSIMYEAQLEELIITVRMEEEMTEIEYVSRAMYRFLSTGAEDYLVIVGIHSPKAFHF